MPRFPPASVQYAEQLLTNGLQQEENIATFYGNGALTGVTVLLAGYALLFSIVLVKPGLPGLPYLVASVCLVVLAGAMMGVAWRLCDVGEQTKPLESTDDLLVKGKSVDDVHEEVVLEMARTYFTDRSELTLVRRLLTAALPIAAAGLTIFVYGVAH
jgi:uncharacterized membrane protein YqjE